MMKRLVYLVTGLAAIAVMGWFFPASRAAGQSVSNDTTVAQYQRALDEQAERSKRYDELLRGQEGIHRRSEALLLTQEGFLKRQVAETPNLATS
jgi:hypothetical protein